jgi:hypothetical protein
MCKLHTEIKDIEYDHNGELLECFVFVSWKIIDGSVVTQEVSLNEVYSATVCYADVSWEGARPLSDLDCLAELKADVLERVKRSYEEGDENWDCLAKEDMHESN